MCSEPENKSNSTHVSAAASSPSQTTSTPVSLKNYFSVWCEFIRFYSDFTAYLTYNILLYWITFFIQSLLSASVHSLFLQFQFYYFYERNEILVSGFQFLSCFCFISIKANPTIMTSPIICSLASILCQTQASFNMTRHRVITTIPSPDFIMMQIQE